MQDSGFSCLNCALLQRLVVRLVVVNVWHGIESMTSTTTYTGYDNTAASLIVAKTPQRWFTRPSDHYFRSVCLSVCLFVCLFVCAEFFSAIFDPISIKLGHMLYVWI